MVTIYGERKDLLMLMIVHAKWNMCICSMQQIKKCKHDVNNIDLDLIVLMWSKSTSKNGFFISSFRPFFIIFRFLFSIIIALLQSLLLLSRFRGFSLKYINRDVVQFVYIFNIECT